MTNNAQRVFEGVQALGQLNETSYLGSIDVLIIESEITIERIAKIGIAHIATASEIVLDGLAHLARLQANRL